MVQAYQAASDYADQMVGRLLDKLDETGRADNTIIVLWSDHGYHLGDKETCVKFTLWEKANRVPFIIVAPGVSIPGSRVDQPVGLIDIYPTLLELAGAPPKADNDGLSLVPLLKHPDGKWVRPALMNEGPGTMPSAPSAGALFVITPARKNSTTTSTTPGNTPTWREILD